MQVFFILFSVYFTVYQYINSKCLYRTHVNAMYISKLLFTEIAVVKEKSGKKIAPSVCH